MEQAHKQSAEQIRSLLLTAPVAPAVFRSALTNVPPIERDAWIDLAFGLDTIPEDDPHLPPNCVPYVPCSVNALLRLVDHAPVNASDVFVDIGSGVGRACAVVHLLTGAAVMGLEIQPTLVCAARDLLARLHVQRFAPIQGDAPQIAGLLTIGSVFFFYCPFSGERLHQTLEAIEPVARTRPLRIACVDLPLPPRPWLALASTPSPDLAIYRTTLCDEPPFRVSRAL